jgi:hypothetical protein
MSQQRIIKNTTVSDIVLQSTGVTIPASGQYTIYAKSWPAWAAATFDGTELVDYINSGDLVVNNGTIDLVASKGIALLRFDVSEHGQIPIISTYNDLPASPTLNQQVIYTPYDLMLIWDGNHWKGPSSNIFVGKNGRGQHHVWLRGTGNTIISPRLFVTNQIGGIYLHEVGSGNNWKVNSLTAKSDQAITGDLEIHEGASLPIPVWASTGKARLQFSNSKYQDSNPSNVILNSHGRVSLFFRYTSGTWDNLVLCMSICIVAGAPA